MITQLHASLDDALWLIPGLSVSNRNNPSQDPRISIRGFGARSAFGVRGIRVLRDGIPLTLPDGQTPVDYLDLESVGRVEVMRGSASSLYGNAGGGVVDIRTADPPSVPVSGALRMSAGAFGTRRLAAKAGGMTAGFTYQANVARTESDGYRDYSRQRMTNGFARISRDDAESSYALEWLGVNTPVAQNPGALTRAQFETDPRLADPLSVRKRARKAVTQSQLGATGRHNVVRGEIEASAYVGTRTLDNPLTFAVVDVGRAMSGGNLRATVPFSLFGAKQRFTAGTELQRQNDLRLNYTNCNNIPAPTAPTPSCPVLGVERGAVTLDQRELVSSWGSYVRDELDFGDRYTLTGSARTDAVRFRVKDKLITATNPDDSGERLLDAGYDVFTYEPRNQGESDVQPDYAPMQWVTDRDAADARAALNYLLSRPDADGSVGVFGVSKGGSVGLLAAATHPAVACAVTDGAFATYSVMVPYMRHWFEIYRASHIPPGLMAPWFYGVIANTGMRRAARERGVRYVNLEDAIHRLAPRPLFMIHGEKDSYIKPSMARALFERAREPKEFWVVEAAKHNQAIEVAPEEYRRRVLEFFDAYLATGALAMAALAAVP
jgi:outer membrane receptor protein involved in Fe transport